jgi:hypothetical protein
MNTLFSETSAFPAPVVLRVKYDSQDGEGHTLLLYFGKEFPAFEALVFTMDALNNIGYRLPPICSEPVCIKNLLVYDAIAIPLEGKQREVTLDLNLITESCGATSSFDFPEQISNISKTLGVGEQFVVEEFSDSFRT